MSEHRDLDRYDLDRDAYDRTRDRELDQREWERDDTRMIPKPHKRYRGTAKEWADIRAAFSAATCYVCGGRWESLHHVYPRGQGGDDVIVNLVPLCGSGTTGCHGLVEARDPQARATLGAKLSDAHRWYVRYKLGEEQGDAWLERHYPPILERAA